ncbi:MAG: cation:dicarboxylase symporter family transporter [Pseudomonadota bacterium]|nr:cation:dicarboxylase symporter family transporter [Pseudomonadota bacterium]
MNLKKILTDPKTVLAGVVGGFIIGLYAPPAGEALFPVGRIYIAFLSMCLLPILITAIVTGIAGLLRDTSTRVLFKSMAIYYLAGLILPCVVGILTALLLGPGTNLGPEAERSIGALILASPAGPREAAGIMGFLAQIIPTNIFEALSTNQVMAIVFFSISMGLALGMIQTRAVDQTLAFIETIYEAFMQLFRWAIVILAPGLLFLIAGVVSQTSVETLLALTKFVGFFYVGGVILMIVYMVLFWLAVRGPVIATLSKLSNTNMLAFMTNNPIIALPVALETLERDYGVDRRVPDLVIPFGIFANQHGAVFLLSFLTVFLAQIYVIDLSIQDYLVIAVGSIIAGATAVGGGAVLIPTVAPILGAVGIPTPLALVVLATTDNIIGPVRTVLTLQSNITLTVMTARPGKEMPAVEEQDDKPEPESA